MKACDGVVALSLLLAVVPASPGIDAANAAAVQTAGTAPDDRADKWRADIDELASILARVHPRYRGNQLPDSLRRRFASLRAKVDSLSDEQIVIQLQSLLASVGDGHTLAWPFAMTRGVLFRAPVQLWSFPDGLYVIDAADRRLVGKRVVGIGSMTAEQAGERAAPYVSHDNNQQLSWATPFYLTLTDLAVAIGAQKSRDSLTLRFSDGGVATVAAGPIDPSHLEIKLIPPKTADPPEYLAHAGDVFRVAPIKPDLLYIGVNGIADAPSKTLAEFGREIRPALDRAAGAIVDLRLNNGGDALKADELLKSLIAFDVRGGQIVVMTSRMTFSAAQTLAARLDQWTNAVFIGEPTGSSPNHFGNEQNFKLPYSGVRGTIASGLNQPVTARDQRAAIEPDFPVPLSASDYFQGRDPVLNVAIAELRKRVRSNPASTVRPARQRD